MLTNFLGGPKILYINDRHEEKDTDKEDRRKLYDKRILPLLEESDFTVFGEKIDSFLLDYYKNLGLAGIKPENIFYAGNYLDYPSLTKAILADAGLVEKLKREKFDCLIPYIESCDTEKLAQRIGTKLLRTADFTDWINNKSNYRQVLKELNFPVIPGDTVKTETGLQYFKELKNQGFKKVVAKRERSVSGFGVFVAENEKDFKQYLENDFMEGENFVLEGFIEDIRYSPNLQYFITEKEINFVVVTNQLLEKDGVSYAGNVHPSAVFKMPDISGIINEMSSKICWYLQKNKCFGIVGIDYIVTRSGDVYSTEANVRINGSTFPALIAKKLFGEEAEIHWLFKTFHFKPISFKKLFDKCKYFIKKKGEFGVLPIGVDLLESMGEGQFMIISRSSKELYDLCGKFQTCLK